MQMYGFGARKREMNNLDSQRRARAALHCAPNVFLMRNPMTKVTWLRSRRVLEFQDLAVDEFKPTTDNCS